MAYTDESCRHGTEDQICTRRPITELCCEDVADTHNPRESQPTRFESHQRGRIGDGGHEMAHTRGKRLQNGGQTDIEAGQNETVGAMAQSQLERCGGSWWEIEPELGRMVDELARGLVKLGTNGGGAIQ